MSGEIRVQGSKNAVFPLVAASILARGSCYFENVPQIADVQNFLEVLKFLGARVKYQDRDLEVDTTELVNRDISQQFMGKLRGSIVLVGAMLARFGRVRFAFPGGDAIGRRPIDQHLSGFAKLGAKIEEEDDWVTIWANQLIGQKIVLGFTTVTGTENLILAAVKAHGVTEIRLAACEPHVQSLCHFLNMMGANIEGIGTPNLRIIGVESLNGGRYTLNPDEIAALTYAVAAAVTRGRVKICGVEPEKMDAVLAVMERMGVNLIVKHNSLEVLEPKAVYQATKIVTGVYPQLLTDYQPLLGVLATQARGETQIHDWIYEGRQGYLRALKEMGARVEFDDLHRSRIHGPCSLKGAEIKTPDIRAGASILIAALVAKGQSILYNAEIIDRGYEKIDENLARLGAKIERVD